MAGSTDAILRNINMQTAAMCFGLAILGIFMYWVWVRVGPVVGKRGKEGMTTAQQTAELVLFSASWCPHCKAAKPDWDRIVSEFDGQQVNGYTVKCRMVECGTESPEVEQQMDRFKVEGFPTLRLVKDGEIINYEGPTTYDGISSFLKGSL